MGIGMENSSFLGILDSLQNFGVLQALDSKKALMNGSNGPQMSLVAERSLYIESETHCISLDNVTFSWHVFW